MYKFNYYEYDVKSRRYTEFHDYGVDVILRKFDNIVGYATAKLSVVVERLQDEGLVCDNVVRDGTETFGRVFVACWEPLEEHEPEETRELPREIEVGFIYRRVD